MTGPMEGVRVLEVADYVFVPAAAAILADWGAEVIKVEHHEKGDAMRGLTGTLPSGLPALWDGLNPILEGANRGKRSIGLNLAVPDGVGLLHRLAAKADVFLTSKLPAVRQRLGCDVEHLRASNPDIIYGCGSAHGARGPDAHRGGFDSLDFWYRSGVASAVKAPDAGGVPIMPSGAFGDHTSAMTLAGGVATALFHRERTGQAVTIDVSLLGQAMWSFAAGVSTSSISRQPMRQPPDWPERIPNPLTRAYRTEDGEWLALCCLQGFRYWAEVCRVIGRPELVADERFVDPGHFADNGVEAARVLTATIASAPMSEWIRRLEHFTGQWARVQDSVGVADDPQVIANGLLAEVTASTGQTFKAVTTPVQFDGVPSPVLSAPSFNQHCESILVDELGIDVDEMLDLKIRGIVA